MSQNDKTTNFLVEIEIENTDKNYDLKQLIKMCLDLPNIKKVSFVKMKTNYCLFTNPSISFSNVTNQELRTYNNW